MSNKVQFTPDEIGTVPHPSTNHSNDSSKTQEPMTPMTPFDVVHDDLEMYRAIVHAFKLLSSKHVEQKSNQKERAKDSTQKHMKRLSLVASGFDEKLAEIALERNDYDITKAVDFIEQNDNATKMIHEANSPDSGSTIDE